MPKKILHRDAVPTQVQERLSVWGRAIRTQRMRQQLRAADLCERMEISAATLRRLERGDPGAGAGLYLAAFQIVGLLDALAPVPEATLWQANPGQRVRLRSNDHDEDYF